MVQRVSLAKARSNLDLVLRGIRTRKHYVLLEERGVPVAGLMDPDELEDYLDTRDPKMQRQIARGYDEYLEGKTRPAQEFLASLDQKLAKRSKKR